jgi:hypothetical protein
MPNLKNKNTTSDPSIVFAHVDELHEWIAHHPQFSWVGDDVLSLIFLSFRKSQHIHR